MSIVGMKVGEIVSAVNRHCNTIANFIKNLENYDVIKHSSRLPPVYEGTLYHIQLLGTNNNMICWKINVELELPVTRQ